MKRAMNRSMHVMGLLLIMGAGACNKTEHYSVKERNSPGHKKVELTPSAPEPETASQRVLSASEGPEWVIVDQVSNVADAVRKETERATRDGKQLVVYVGAVWCKPCKEFQAASEQRGFGEELSSLRFMKFDWDLHQSPLIRAGYGSQYLPLFVLPNDDGKGSEKRMFGARGKGREAIENLKERLLALVASSR